MHLQTGLQILSKDLSRFRGRSVRCCYRVHKCGLWRGEGDVYLVEHRDALAEMLAPEKTTRAFPIGQLFWGNIDTSKERWRWWQGGHGRAECRYGPCGQESKDRVSLVATAPYLAAILYFCFAWRWLFPSRFFPWLLFNDHTQWHQVRRMFS